MAFTFDPTQIVRTQIQFVTTGQIKLMLGEIPTYLLLQDDGNLLKEDSGKLELEEDDD